MGFDVEYPQANSSDSELISKCRSEGRVLLTRDHELYSRYPRSLLIRSGNFKEQVVQFISSFSPEEEKYFTRCTECNGLLVKLDQNERCECIPESVRDRELEVWKCNDCGKVYWKGSHYESILRQIRKFEAEIK